MNPPVTYLYRLGLVCLLALPAVPGSAQEAAARRSLPQLSVDLNSLAYPGAAQRAGLQGRVLLAFNISSRGRAEDVLIMSAEPSEEFDAAATRAVRQVRFTVPDDWEESGGAAHRFTLSVLFKLSPCVEPACIAPRPHETADDFLVIGAQAK